MIRKDLSNNVFRTPLTEIGDFAVNNEEKSPETEAIKKDDSENETPLEDKTPPHVPDKTTEKKAPEVETVTNNNSEVTPVPEDNNLPDIPNETAVVEAEYSKWINHLKQQYAIEIDWKLWEIIEQEQTDGV